MFVLLSWRNAPACVNDNQGRTAPMVDRLARRFAGNRDGGVAIIFALTTLVVMLLVGGAVDFGRWMGARVQQQAAMDSAVLAAGRVLQTTSNNTTLALQTAENYFDRMKSQITVREARTFALEAGDTVVTMTADAFVRTPFLNMMGIAELPILLTARAELASGGNGEFNLEIGMMLDITGSMGGQKIEDMKLAAKDLIDIVVWADQSQYTSKIAIVPFAPRVNVGGYASQLTGLAAKSGKNALRPCVTERTGTHAFTDEAPAAGRYLGRYDGSTSSTSGSYNSTGTCAESSSGADPTNAQRIMPLSNDKNALKARVNALTDRGGTAGQLGTAWAWYLISPKWQSIWPSASCPAAYSELTTMNSYGQPRLRKIAILMTDGEYNTTGGSQQSSKSATTTISNNAVTICNNMKAAGITVYTVGFDLDGNQLAISTLSNCASGPEYFFNTTTGDELRQAFREIALQISTLRIKS